MKKETVKTLLHIAALVLFLVVVTSVIARPVFVHIKKYIESLVVAENYDDDYITDLSPDKIENILASNNNSSLAISSKIYGYKNTPIKIYFANITEYISHENLIFKVKDGGKGKTYKDRWEYTPKKAEKFIIEISVYDNNEVFIDSVKTLIEIKDSSKEEISVLVLGDSTIEAAYETETLLELSDKDNYSLSLVGTKTSFFNNPLNVHEGRGGWSAYLYTNGYEALSATNPFYNSYSEGDYEFDFSYYMNQNGFEKLDCVVLQLGINDVYGLNNDSDLNFAAENYLHYMEYMIKSIRAYDPDIKIVWNLILPPSSDEYIFDSDYTAQRAKRNTYLTNLDIIRRYSNFKNIYICPINASIDCKNNMADYVHPTQEGYEEIGTMLYGFIRGIN